MPPLILLECGLAHYEQDSVRIGSSCCMHRAISVRTSRRIADVRHAPPSSLYSPIGGTVQRPLPRLPGQWVVDVVHAWVPGGSPIPGGNTGTEYVKTPLAASLRVTNEQAVKPVDHKLFPVREVAVQAYYGAPEIGVPCLGPQ